MQDNIDSIIKLRDAIEMLDKDKHIGILNIFKKNNIEYSSNKNGTFINLSILESNIIKELEKFMGYLNKQERIINEMEDKKLSYESDFFS